MKTRFTILSIMIVAIAGVFHACTDYADFVKGSAGTVTETPPNQVVAPVYSPPAGTFTSDQNVSISTTPADAVICYTNDGSAPACNSAKDGCEAGSTQYAAALNLSATTSLKAVACKSGMDDSTIANATITIDYEAVSTPQYSPPAGTFTSDQNVSISTTPADALICYTNDGSTTPACNSAKDGCATGTKYIAPVSVAEGTTSLKALACKAGYNDSTLATATYTKETTAPSLSSTTPDDAATGVDPTTGTITLVFSETMDTSQTTHTLTTGIWNNSNYVSTPNSATFTWENATTLKIQLSWVQFPENSQIQWTLTKTNIKDAAGNVLAADITRSFTTTARRTYFPIADTGQTACYNAGGSQACGNTDWPRQDADYADTPIARSFTGPTAHATHTSDYTTTDNVTSLVWKSCSEGQSGSACGTGAASTMTWNNAVNQCAAMNTANAGAGYAGRTDWRLPTASELETLLNYGTSSPAIDTASFPATPTGAYTWTSTTVLASPANAWAVSFSNGGVGSNLKTTNYYVRCVSSEPSSAASYTDNGDGTVTDSTTNLVWQQCSAGLSGTSCGTGTAETKTWQVALEYCENLNLDGRTWRLPSVNELKTIVDRSKTAAPYIDTLHFPATVSNFYWTSTTYIASPDSAWRVYFYSGYVNVSGKTNNRYVRCVSSGP